jgi:predicted MFS family arabinose efflux permease
VLVYRWVALAATIPILLVTHLGHAPLWLWISVTSMFFVLVSGRMIPAMAVITSAAQSRVRGTFMSLNGTVQSLAMALATSLAGLIIALAPDGRIVGYEWVGYVAIAANLAAIVFASRIALHGQADQTPP